MRIHRTLLAACLFVVAAACAPESRVPSPTEPQTTTTTAPATTTTTVTVEEATATFRDCLVQNGVTVPEIPFDSQGRPRLELALTEADFADREAAEVLSSCSGQLAQGALDLAAWPALQSMVQEALADFAECVRAEGVVAFPDPVRGFTGVGGPFPLDEIPYDHPDLRAAINSCRSSVPAGES